MRWRQSFLAEVSQAIRQLGLTACPVCGLADSLDVGHLPELLFDGLPSDGDMTFAVRVECSACGYLMLFNAQRFRSADEEIIAADGTEEGGQLAE